MTSAPAGKSGRTRRVRVPTILQFEAVECGAAALAMVLAHHGAFIPLEQLRVACGVSRDGANAANMLKAARSFGLEAKGFRAEGLGLANFPLPAILHWNFNHFVVLEGLGRDVAWINDPAEGPRAVPLAEFDAAFTGVVLTFRPTDAFRRTGRPAGLVRAVAGRLSGARTAFALLALLSLCLVIPGLLVPLFARILVDDVLLDGQRHWIGPLLIGMALTALARAVLMLLRQRLLIRLETRMAVAGATRFLWHLLRLPAAFFTQRHPGEVASRVSGNDQVARALSGEVSAQIVNLGEALVFALAMLAYDPRLACIPLALAAANLLLLRGMRQRMDLTTRQLVAARGKLEAATVGAIQTLDTIRASGLEEPVFERWAGLHAGTTAVTLRQNRNGLVLTVIPLVLRGLADAAVLTIGALQVMSGRLSVGDLVAFQSLAVSFAAPVAALTGLGPLLSAVKIALQRLDDVLNHPLHSAFTAPAAARDAPPPPADALPGSVEISGLSFGYSRAGPPVLDGIDVHIGPGQRIALVGGSGSGKSTVGRLVAGLLTPWSGTLRFDGIDSADLPHAARAQRLGYVDQTVFLFEGTVRDNLTLWDPTIPDAALLQALEDAALLDHVLGRPGGLDARVAEGGTNFSGGQAQRLEIARALVNDPALLVLDEATAALDAETETRIDAALRRRGCACLIIAHRLSTIRDCDEILVLAGGRVQKRGAHAALLARNGAYAALVRAL